MRFYNPAPCASAAGAERAKSKSIRQNGSRRGSAWSRKVLNANGNVAVAIFSKPNGLYNRGGILMAIQNAGGNRYGMKVWKADGSQIDGLVYSAGGLDGLEAALAGKADLDDNFYIRIGNTEDEALDATSGFADAQPLIQI